MITATPKEGRSGAETLVIGLILVAVVGGGILLLNGGRLPGTGTVDMENAPPAGSIWFGDSYDPATFALTGQGNHVSATQAVALVAHLSRPSRGEYLVVNVGDTTGSVPLGGGQIQSGFDLMAYLVPSDLLYSGTFTVTITDSGGNVLASDFLYVD